MDVLKKTIKALSEVTARELTEKDFPPYRKLFLRALKEEGHYFGPTYESRKKVPDHEWIERFKPTKDHQYFGLFHKTNLIGVLFASLWDQDQSGETAIWGSAYIAPEYRGQGLGAQLYQAREKWTNEHPTFKRAVFFILEGNKRSTEIHEKQNASHISTEVMNWPDRPPTLWRWYEKSIKQATTQTQPNVA